MEAEDKDTEFRARQEVLEETGLHESDLHLVRAGRSQKIMSEGRVRFIVHPFLFHLRAGSATKIKLDWEHEDSDWIPLDKVKDKETVPNLIGTILRVWVPPKIAAGLDQIANDKVSGAQEMTASAISLLQLACTPENVAKCSEIAPIESSEAALSHAVDIGYLIAGSRPSMGAAMRNVLALTLWRVWEKLGELKMVEETFEAVRKSAEQVEVERRTAQQRMTDAFLALASGIASSIPGELGILTHSASSSVLASLLALHAEAKVLFHVYITESRPLFEGVGLAAKLGQKGVGVTVITDAAGLWIMKDRNRLIKMVVLGSDQLLPPSVERPRGAAVNKLGSTLVALAAREFGLTDNLYIVSSTDKLSDTEPNVEMNSPEEVSRSWSATPVVDVLNPYFEEIPGELIGGYVTEKGVVDSKGLGEAWTEMQEARKVWDL
jgi:translation initiation factor 2B subunit (eIF-2B alpha/beta/delta family)